MDAERARAARNKQSKVVAPAEDLVSFPDPQDKASSLRRLERRIGCPLGFLGNAAGTAHCCLDSGVVLCSYLVVWLCCLPFRNPSNCRANGMPMVGMANSGHQNAQRGYLFKKGRGRKTFVRPWTQRLFELSVADLKIRYYAESAE